VRLRLAALAAWVYSGVALGAAAPAPGAEAFDVSAEAPAVHLLARYRGGDGRWHRLEAWRRGETFVHRRTDDGSDLYVEADPAYAGHYRYRVLDPRRKVLIEVDRTNLLRIGVFSDWFSLAHLIKPPAAGVRVEAVPPPAVLAQADGAALDAAMPACEWLRLLPQPGAVDAPLDVCWSKTYAVPVRVQVAARDDEAPALLMALESAQTVDAASDALLPPPLAPGYSYIDANADIDPAGD